MEQGIASCLFSTVSRDFVQILTPTTVSMGFAGRESQRNRTEGLLQEELVTFNLL